MLVATRRNLIKDQVLEKKSVTVPALAAEFNVTEETIRRDLKYLESEGVLSRTYGGAYVQEGVQNEVEYSVRMDAYVDSKTKIAQAASLLVRHGDSIYLDASTTAVYLANAVSNMRITVITNSLTILNRLTGRQNIQLIGIGGAYDSGTNAFLGPSAIEMLRRFHMDKAFLSCRSLSMKFGLTDSHEHQAQIRQVVLESTDEPYIIADHSKFNYASFIKIDDFRSVHGIITDKPLSEAWHSFCSERNIICLD